MSPQPPARPVYPLKASANNRYLVDQNDMPFLMVAMLRRPWLPICSDRCRHVHGQPRAYGINTLWINLLCNYSDGCKKDARHSTASPPLLSRRPLDAKPGLFQRADDMINIAAANGQVVL